MTNIENDTHITPSSTGEDNALQGFINQYRVAAELVIKALSRTDFEKVILKDPKAGPTDDVQIVSTYRIDAYQIKWHQPPSHLNTSDLCGASDTEPGGLINELAIGWKALSRERSNCEVNVHLFTTKTSAHCVHCLKGTERGPKYLESFLNEYWNIESPSASSLAKWKPFIKKLEIASGLTTNEFIEFRYRCIFDLNRRDAAEREEYQSSSSYYRDITHLANMLLELAGRKRGIIELDQNDILQLASWKHRFEFKGDHSFPTPSSYFPIEVTVRQLSQSIKDYNKGYLALIGSPGSGKSTLLTKTLSSMVNIIVTKYYCYIPDNNYLGRSEAYSFLHDVCLMLHNTKIIPRTQGFSIDNIEELRLEFRKQLNQLGDLWREKGIRSIFLIDGLDHIKRETNPSHSLLNELLTPEAIPEGCLFILGTQNIDHVGLSPSIVQHLLSNESRQLTMSVLDRRSIREITGMVLPDQLLSPKALEGIETRSAGHPLALNYILNRLSAVNASSVEDVINTIPAYSGNIENEYDIYWKELERVTDLRTLLALLSRVRIPLEFKLISELASDETVKELVSSAKHYFVDHSKTAWRFFHNSFRQFVLDKTRRNHFGLDDESIDRGFHRTLAAKTETESVSDTFKWERLYHTYHSKDFLKVIEIGSQEYFREQLFSLRSPDSIIDDTKLVIRSALMQEDFLAVIRVLLIESEINQRRDIFEEIDIHSLLLKIGNTNGALNYVLNNGKLLVSVSKALDFAATLADFGSTSDAKTIFDIAEPLDHLSNMGRKTPSRNDTLHLLAKWVRSAMRFQSPQEVLEKIGNFYRLANSHSENRIRSDSADSMILYTVFSNEFMDLKGVRKFQEFFDKNLSAFPNKKDIFIEIALESINSKNDTELRLNGLDYLSSNKLHGELSNHILLRIVYILLVELDNKQEAKQILSLTRKPDRNLIGSTTKNHTSYYMDFFRYYSFHCAFGNLSDPLEAVPNAKNKHFQGNVIIERMIVRMANVWGSAYREQKPSTSEVIRNLLPPIRIFERWDDRELRLSLSGIQKVYLNILIYSAAIHGTEAFSELETLLQEHWEVEETKKFWYEPLRRHLVLQFYRFNKKKELCIQRLLALEPLLDPDSNIREYVESCEEQFSTWIKIGEISHAKSVFSKIVRNSFGLYHEKDPQIRYWKDWYLLMLREHRDSAIEHVDVITDGIASAAVYKRGSSASDVAASLLSGLYITAPILADTVKDSFCNFGVLSIIQVLKAQIIAGMNSNSVPFELAFTIFIRLYIPLAEHSDKDVIEPVVVKLNSLRKQTASSHIKRLINCIQRDVSPDLCGDWWLDLRNSFISKGLDCSLLALVTHRLELQKPVREYSKGNVILTNGDTIEEDDLIERAKSAADLIYIIEHISKDNFYNWYSIVNNILDTLNKDQAKRLFNGLIAIGKGGVHLSGLSRRMHELGDNDMAKEYALKALEQSTSYGWFTSYDGGSRIEPYKLLVNIDSQYRLRAFKHFVTDYLDGTKIYQSTLILNDLISIFWPAPADLAIWKEVYGHFRQLREFHEPDVKLPVDLDLSEPASDDLTHAMVDQVFMLFEIPQPEVRENAYKTLIDMFNVSHYTRSFFPTYIFERLSMKSDLILGAISLIRGISEIQNTFVNQFADTLGTLLNHDDIAVRFAAKHALRKCDGIIHPIKRSRKLPIVYSIELPDFATMEQRYTGAIIDEGSLLPDTKDSLQAVGVVQSALEFISRATGISFRVLVERTAALMNTVAHKAEWDKSAEASLRAQLDLMDIKLPYRRPRAQAAFTSLGHVVAELFDADKLDRHNINTLESFLSIYSATLSMVDPIRENISPVSGSITSDYNANYKAWLTEDVEILEHPPRLDDGSIVIGFETMSMSASHEKPSELISGCLCPPNIDKSYIRNSSGELIPGGFMSWLWLADHYPGIPNINTALEQSFLVKSTSIRVELGRTEWLAINPLIPTRLGWKANRDGLFEWVDDSGRMMVKSIWWRNGRPTKFIYSSAVRSEGWITVASPEGFEALKEELIPMNWAYRLKRSFSGKTSDRFWVSSI